MTADVITLFVLHDRIWEESGQDVAAKLCSLMIADVIHDEAVVRESTAEALAACLATHGNRIDTVLQQLIEVYEEKLYVSVTTER